MGIKVCKFGGTSLADAGQIRKVQAIVDADPDRRFVVPSAPGKRFPEDRKITDLLYLCHEHVKQKIPFDDVFELIADRYRRIVSELGLDLDLEPTLAEVSARIGTETAADYAASRGEYLCGLILATILDIPFIDAAEVIFFNQRGRLDEKRTQAALAQRLPKGARGVIPGFYGSDPRGEVRTFTRGGSDITGALVARGVAANVYENWTDVPGMLTADPRIVDQPRKIDIVTYRELRELAYMGATVLHDEAIFPVRLAGIPVNIRNTNNPDDSGTLIVAETDPHRHRGSITGVAGRKDFTVVAVEKALMNSEIGFGRRLLGVFEGHGVSYEHTPTGIDTMSIVVSSAGLHGKLDAILRDIRSECHPDALEVYPKLALIATVGRGMAHTPGSAAKLFGALAEASVNIRMIDQGSSELNIIVGVEESDFETAVRAIYHAFFD